MRATVIVNTRSGAVFARRRCRIDAARLARVFEEAGVTADIVPFAGGDLERIVRAAADRSHDAIVIGGGDGSVSTAARILAGTGIALGVLPMGTFNYFARLLGIPLDLGAAVRMVAEGRSDLIDAVAVNGTIAVIYSSIGIFPTFIHERTRLQLAMGWPKGPAMIAALVRSFVRFPVLDITLAAPGERRTAATPFLLAGNSRNALNPLILGGGHIAALKDGTFSLCLGREKTRLGLLRTALDAAVGTLDLERDFDLLELTECEVHAGRGRLLVALDGEIAHMKPPIRYHIRPGILRVITPDATEESERPARS